MTIKKLSLAAAISVGALAMGASVAIAASGSLPVVTGAACEPTCPQCCPADSVFPQAISPRIELEPCDHCVSPACPIEEPCEPCCPQPACPCDPCDPCQCQPACPCDPCDPCQCQPACPCEPCAPCDAACGPCPVPACPVESGPACATCQGVPEKRDFCERQVYAYPSEIFGKPTAVTGDPYSMGLAGFCCPSNACPQNGASGLTTARGTNSCACQTCPTGEAANIPCYDDVCGIGCNQEGIGVSRDEVGKDGFGCPITVHSSKSKQVIKKSMLPLEIKTGGAAPLTHSFCDVPADFWAVDIINKLSASKVIAGYPDQTFRPNCPVTRAEFASLVVSGLNYQGEKYYDEAIFKDVPADNWANSHIDKGLNAGLIAGYPDGLFKPNCNVTRAEALVIMSKALKDCELDECNAKQILSQYCDSNDVPNWAELSIAQALKAGILENTPTPNQIKPNLYATRAEIAAMLSSMRIALGIDPEPVACGCVETGAAAYVEQSEIIKIPTLNVKLEDSVSARENHVGDKFVARSVECITVNGATFPADSKVYGQIVEVVRPTRNNEGALKIAFTEIKNGSMKAQLPNEILTAQVQKEHKPNAFSRVAKWPFTWTGRLIGDVGRTAGSILMVGGNGIEEVINGFGTATGELFQGKFMAAGRSVVGSTVALLRTPVDMTRTALSGTAGLFNITADEVAFVISADGTKVAQINPNETVTVAFGCQ